MRRLAAFSAACCIAACGLYEGGAAIDDGGIAGDAAADTGATDSGSGGDADGGGGADVVVLPEAGGCDAGATSLIVTSAGGCPQGTTVENLVTNPVAGGGACACGACVPTTQPNCAGAVTFAWGGSNSCSSGPWNLNASSSCTAFQSTFNAADYNRWSQLLPTAGACNAPTQANLGQVQTTPVTRCVIPAQSPEIACAAEQAGGFRLCVPYNAGCSGKYSAVVDVGTAPTLFCSACACSLTATTCTVEYHGNSQCNQLKYKRLLDGQCASTGNPQGNAYFKAYPTDPTCTPTAGAPTTGLANANRLCCTP